ncbi:hypothetical protein P5673_019619 [Acropora cervicornis]|uniref:Uncharacterized protein n=1 Tax=Acropora cervicornis TaxID=6130 RepID=A0AAD9V276_ACRCE|nr:hypothetical protein P5673_019619 [Acropora cervicornis]
MRDWNRKNPPNPSNLLKQWRPISLEAPAPVIHRSTEGSLDVRGKSRSQHLIRNHNFKGGVNSTKCADTFALFVFSSLYWLLMRSGTPHSSREVRELYMAIPQSCLSKILLWNWPKSIC